MLDNSLPTGSNTIGAVTVNPNSCTPTGNTGTVTTTLAATDYTIAASNTSRKLFKFTNTSTALIYVNLASAAYSSSVYYGDQVQPGQAIGYDSAIPTSAIHIASATAGSTAYLLECQ